MLMLTGQPWVGSTMGGIQSAPVEKLPVPLGAQCGGLSLCECIASISFSRNHHVDRPSILRRRARKPCAAKRICTALQQIHFWKLSRIGHRGGTP